MEVVKNDQLILSTDWVEQLASLKQRILFVGNDLPIHQDIFTEGLGKFAHITDAVDFNPRPSILAMLGEARPEEAIHTFTPNYIRLAEAEANWLKANKEKKEDRG